MKKSNIGEVKDFLLGEETSCHIWDGFDSFHLMKAPAPKWKLVAVYISRDLTNEIRQTLKMDLAFYYHTEKQVIIMPENGWDVSEFQKMFGNLNYASIEDAMTELGMEWVDASSIKKEIVNAVKGRYIRILLKDYPDFDSIPEEIQEDVIYDCKEMSISDMSSDLQLDDILFKSVQDFEVASELVFNGKRWAMNLVKSAFEKNKEDILFELGSYYKQKEILSLVS